MKPILSYNGNTYYENVPAWGNAADLLFKHGMCPVEGRRQWHIERAWWLPNGEKKCYGIHYYFFDRNGKEIAYWTEIMNILRIHKDPRIWGEVIKLQAENFWTA